MSRVYVAILVSITALSGCGGQRCQCTLRVGAELAELDDQVLKKLVIVPDDQSFPRVNEIIGTNQLDSVRSARLVGWRKMPSGKEERFQATVRDGWIVHAFFEESREFLGGATEGGVRVMRLAEFIGKVGEPRVTELNGARVIDVSSRTVLKGLNGRVSELFDGGLLGAGEACESRIERGVVRRTERFSRD